MSLQSLGLNGDFRQDKGAVFSFIRPHPLPLPAPPFPPFLPPTSPSLSPCLPPLPRAVTEGGERPGLGWWGDMRKVPLQPANVHHSKPVIAEVLTPPDPAIPLPRRRQEPGVRESRAGVGRQVGGLCQGSRWEQGGESTRGSRAEQGFAAEPASCSGACLSEPRGPSPCPPRAHPGTAAPHPGSPCCGLLSNSPPLCPPVTPR